MAKQITYKDAGVDIEKAEKSLARVKNAIARTHNKNVLKNIGAFGGFYEFPINEYRQPVLISSTDGVGTKLNVAVKAGKHDTVGQDLVNHCIDDIAVCGAKPLFFLDYFASGKLEPAVYESVILGFATACEKAGLPLIGGETAEMPDLYPDGEYDLAGTIVGVVEKEEIIDGSAIQAGDWMVGVPSSGLHTNGYSLARKVLFSHYQPHDFVEELDCTVAEELLKIHINYYPVIKAVREKYPVRGMAHITGGGLFKNTIRVVPEGLTPKFDYGNWPEPPIFGLIRRLGNVPEEDMRQTFNLGIGLVFVLPENAARKLLEEQEALGEPFYKVGTIE